MKEKKYTKEERDALRSKLADKQVVVKEKKLPVIVMLEGFGAAGKGSAISSTIRFMDPRFFKVYNMDKITEEEERRPFLYRYAVKMPAQGQFTFFDGGYIDEIVKRSQNKKQMKQRIESMNNFERSMTDNGYLIVKIYLHVDKKTQKNRLKELLEHKNTAWRVTKEDLEQNENFEYYEEAYGKVREQTNTKCCPWHVLESAHLSDVEGEIISIITNAIDARIAADEKNGKDRPLQQNPYTLLPATKLSKVSLQDKTIADDAYQEELKSLQKKLGKLHNKLYRKRIPLIVAYEGWDAAGKGGNIKRVASALDARGYEVLPIASPSPEEKARHFLYRFYTRLPKSGHIAIFDRTWYGRVMVERLEGFCSENDWQRAFHEMNEFEHDLTADGAIVVKFWVHIDKDTQLARFNDRQNTPEKQWKITEEDWRNREKWDQYEVAIDEMIAKTNTDFAPWTILESNDKHYARIKALKTIIAAIEKRLEA
ncbi:MAG: polyphosphate:AMP phosphotransferase [Lachnospiraceae bacterium]|nr:polyphosphate:AMP phosphotransferase [Lachnospiraceae bacterium]